MKFETEEQCLQYLFDLQYGRNKPVCSECRRRDSYHKHPKKRCYTCTCGGSHIYPQKGTIFEGSRVPLLKWFIAIELMKKNPEMSVRELQRELDVAYQTAWRIKDRLATKDKEYI